jgi:hypothetical protein
MADRRFRHDLTPSNPSSFLPHPFCLLPPPFTLLLSPSFFLPPPFSLLPPPFTILPSLLLSSLSLLHHPYSLLTSPSSLHCPVSQTTLSNGHFLGWHISNIYKAYRFCARQHHRLTIVLNLQFYAEVCIFFKIFLGKFAMLHTNATYAVLLKPINFTTGYSLKPASAGWPAVHQCKVDN